jgi:hypothetical protein
MLIVKIGHSPYWYRCRLPEKNARLEFCFNPRRGELLESGGSSLQYRSHSGQTKHRYIDEQYIEVGFLDSVARPLYQIDV